MATFSQAATPEYPFPLDAFQRSAGDALRRGESVVAAAPTGAGKTVVASLAADRALETGRRCWLLSPLKALSGQHFRTWQARYGAERVGLLTGDLTHQPEAPLLVATTEIYHQTLRRRPGGEPHLAVLDEAHLLGDPQRGWVWEEICLRAGPATQLALLSATIPNADEIVGWLRSLGRTVTLVEVAERPVPLEYFLDDGDGWVLVQDRQGRAGSVAPRGGGELAAALATGEAHTAVATPSPARVLARLREHDRLPALYFVSSRRLSEGIAEEAALGDAGADASAIVAAAAPFFAALTPELAALSQTVALRRLLPRGVAFHHAGLLPQLRRLVEDLLAAGLLNLVVATDTLALGINVPARAVVLHDLTRF
ncbi:MAG: DEAD/DEAH box helicase, partial [Chloroflexi bacterium]|nr:DEAD/DEAH box helicase [Chloroflexota bacterium]